MFDNILNLVKQQAVGKLLEQGLGQGIAEKAAAVTGGSIVNSLTQEVTSGNISGVTDLLSGKGGGLQDNPIFGKVMGAVTGGLQSDTGMSAEQSSGIAGSLLPGLMQQITGKFNSTAQADSGFDIASIAGSLLDDGKPGGIDDTIRNVGGMLGGLFGKK